MKELIIFIVIFAGCIAALKSNESDKGYLKHSRNYMIIPKKIQKEDYI